MSDSINALIRKTEKQLKGWKKNLEQARKREKACRDAWNARNKQYMKKVESLAKIARFGTNKHTALRQFVLTFNQQVGKELTKQRDIHRLEILNAQESIANLQAQLDVLRAQMVGDQKSEDETINQVFNLNTVAVEASRNRENYLTSHLFHRLVDAEGRLHSQITLTSSDGLRRVIALVNTITIVEPDLAAKAQDLVKEFFDQFRENDTLDPVIKPFFDISQKLLVVKSRFKVGPTLYQFIGMELDPDLCPQLVEAQDLLRRSIRSEKTSKYIRLKIRKDHSSPWEVVKQS